MTHTHNGVDHENMSDAELDECRRQATIEQERRVNAARGLEQIGTAFRTYCQAVNLDLFDAETTDEELGERIVTIIQDSEEEDE